MIKPVVIYLSILFFSCSSGYVPNGILNHTKMKKVVSELLQVDEFINNYIVKDSSINVKKKRSVLYEQVFTINNTSRQQFYSSFKYYQEHPDINKTLFDSLYEDLNRKIEPVASGKALKDSLKTQ